MTSACMTSAAGPLQTLAVHPPAVLERKRQKVYNGLVLKADLVQAVSVTRLGCCAGSPFWGWHS